MTGSRDDNEAGTTPRPAAGSDPLAGMVAVMGEALGSVVDVGAWRLDEQTLLDRFADLLRVRAQVEEVTARLAASVVARDLPRLAGASSTKAWLMSVHGMSAAAAARLVAESTAHPGEVDGVLRDGRTETTRTAWAAGDLSAERAVLIARTIDRLPADLPADRTDALQRDLARHSRVLSYSQLQHACRHAVGVVDPDGADRLLEAQLIAEEAQALQATELWMRHAGPGQVRLGGLIPTLHADMLIAALNAHTSPRHHPTTRPTHPDGPDTAGTDTHPYQPVGADDGTDQLTLRQRNGRAFLEIIEHLPATDLPQHGVANATIVVTIGLDQLHTGLGEATLDNGDPISAGQTRRLACNAGLLPAVLDSPSTILDLGTTQRLFNRHQRLALAIRDKGCTWPGCDRPPNGCEAHHLTRWTHGGPTNLNNGCLLCPFHHHLIHAGEWSTVMAPDGIPEIIPPERVDPTRTPRRHQRLKHPALC